MSPHHSSNQERARMALTLSFVGKRAGCTRRLLDLNLRTKHWEGDDSWPLVHFEEYLACERRSGRGLSFLCRIDSVLSKNWLRFRHVAWPIRRIANFETNTSYLSSHRFILQTIIQTIPHKEYMFEAGSMEMLNTSAFSPREVS